MHKAFQVLLSGIIFASLICVNQFQNHTSVADAAMVQGCKCGRSNCRGCAVRKRRCRKCPKCQNDVCVLKAECVKDERVCFEVEQKLICIPKVSLPWRKCEKPCSGGCSSNCRHKCAKTKTVKVLKTKVYECDVCKYSWKVYEPEAQQATTDSAAEGKQPVAQPEYETPAEPQYDNSELYDPAGGDVPKAPKTSDAVKLLLQRINRR